MSQFSRVPASCPPGFLGRHVVLPGETMFIIAQFFRVRLEDLIRANPHIQNPNLIFPGDVLCVPGQVPFPCCVVLLPRVPVPQGTSAGALVHTFFTGAQAVTVGATLPPPSAFGDFNAYRVHVVIPGVAEFTEQLSATPEVPPTWAATVSLPTVAVLSPDTRVAIEPIKTTTSAVGPAILDNTLATCH